MFKKEKELNLSELVDMNFLQELQDVFAKTMNIASLTYDDTKPVTRPSNFSECCSKHTRASSLGLQRCHDCDLNGGRIASEKGKPVIYKCHAGLTDFAVPIIVEGEHIGTILGGQVLTEEPDEEAFREIARQLSINEDEYIKSIRKIKIVSEEQVKAAADLLFLVANSISEIGHKNLNLIQKNIKDNLHKAITETIRSSLDINETQKKIVNIIGEILDPDRCFIAIYDNDQDKFLCIDNEYLSSKNIEGYKGLDINIEFPNFISVLKQGKPIIVNNNFIYSDTDNKDFTKEKEAIEKQKIKSRLAFPLFYMNELQGCIVIHYINNAHKINEEEVELFSAIAEQIAIALYQAKMYNKIQLQANREKILREIVSKISSTLVFNEIKQTLVNKLGKALAADFAVVYTLDQKTQRFLPIDEYSVHLKSEDTQSPVGLNILEDYGWGDYIRENTKSEIIYSDIENLKREYSLYDTKAEECLDFYQTKSIIAIPIIYANNFIGFLVISFTKEQRTITEEDLNLVRIITNHAALALYQAKLYEQANESARLKSDFIANMSHELKTPLNIIIGFSDILYNSELDRKKEVEYLKNINKSGRHLLDLTNDIINISKIESGNFELNYENIDIKELIFGVVSSIKLIADEKEINIKMETTNAKISADKKMLTQILYNLLHNAIKFTPSGGTITIESEISNDELIISIEDTGIGIAAKDKNIIFEKFKQLNTIGDVNQQGSGLGLSIIKKLVELHNGTIYVESIEGKGSRFWFSLPKIKKMSTMVSKNCL